MCRRELGPGGGVEGTKCPVNSLGQAGNGKLILKHVDTNPYLGKYLYVITAADLENGWDAP